MASAPNFLRFSRMTIALTLAFGCGTTGVVHLDDQLIGCNLSLAIGVDGAPVDEHLIATPDLACTLSALREVDAPNVLQSLQGARVSAEMSARSTNDDQMKGFAQECMRWARQAASNEKVRAEARYWEGQCLGNVVRHSAFSAVKNMPKLERVLTEAVEGAPDVDDGGPLRVLGMLYVKAPAWPQGIGDVDRGLELIAKSVERFPDHPLNRLFMAMALWDVEEDRDGAIREFEAALGLMRKDRWTYLAPGWRKEATGLARDLGVQLPE